MALWRTEDPVLREDGSIAKGGLFPPQRAWWNLPNFIRIFVSGYGAGKTIVLCKRMIALALENAPKAPVAIVSPTYPMARETTIATTRYLLELKKRGRDGFDWWENQRAPHTFFVRDGGYVGRILVYSGDQPYRIKGINLAAAGIDETFLQEIDVFHQLLARIRHPEAKKLELNMVGTSEQLNWGYDLVEGDLRKKHDVGFVRASSRENPMLPPEFVPRLEAAYTEKEAQAFIDGYFVNLSTGLVCNTFSRRDNVMPMKRPHGSTLAFGIDFNVTPMAAVVFWYLREHMHYVMEYELPSSNTEEMCALLRERYWDQGMRDCYPDASGVARSSKGAHSDFEYIRQAGFVVNARSTNPRVRDRFAAINAKFRSRDGRITATVAPECTKLIRYLSTYSWEQMPRQKAMSHLIDAATYPPAYLFPKDKQTIVELRLVGV